MSRWPQAPQRLLPRLIAAARRWILTANSPVKVGVLISLVGVGLLVREASARGFIDVPIEVRLAAISLLGVAMLLFGWRQRARRQVFGLSLQGGGVSVLYLTTFAAFSLYDVLPAVPALAAVAAITLGAGALALAQHSLSLALLGLLGGYLAPVLAYRWPDDHLIVFSFYASLNVGGILIARMRAWPQLTLLGYAFTFGVSGLWLLTRTGNSDWAELQPFIAFFVLLYIAVPAALAPGSLFEGGSPSVRGVWTAPLLFGTPFIGLGLQGLLVGHTDHGLMISALVLAALHAALHFAARRHGERGQAVSVAYAAIATTLVALAVPLAFDTFATSTVWAFQGALLVWAGIRWRHALPAIGGAILQFVAAATYAVSLIRASGGDPGDPYLLWFWRDATPVANPYCLSAAALAVCSIAIAVTICRQSVLSDLDAWSRWVALFWGLSWWSFAALVEVGLRFDAFRLWATLGFVMLTLGALVAASRWLRWRELDAAGTLMLPALGVSLAVAHESKPFLTADFGWAVWPPAFVMYAAFLRTGDARRPQWAGVLHAGGFWVASAFAGVEIYRRVGDVLDGVWPLAASLTALVALAIGTIWARTALSWPVSSHQRTYLFGCIAPLLAVTSAAALGMVVLSDGDPQPLPYIPLLNPLELFVAASVATALWWRKLVRSHAAASAAVPAEEPVSEEPAVSESAQWADSLGGLASRSWAPVLGAASVVAVSMTAARAVHHWLDVPFEADALMRSTELQATLSIVWALVALTAMVAGVRRQHRRTWLAGAGWMAVVIAKLFIVDLARLTALPRIASFIGVGLLLIIVGYFAPVPPAASARTDHPEESTEPAPERPHRWLGAAGVTLAAVLLGATVVVLLIDDSDGDDTLGPLDDSASALAAPETLPATDLSPVASAPDADPATPLLTTRVPASSSPVAQPAPTTVAEPQQTPVSEPGRTEAPPPSEAPVSTPVFDTRGCTITGTRDVVEIVGTEGDDVLCVPDPHDTNAFHVLDGRGGNDIIYGGDGVDWIYGGSGADTIYALGEDDRIVAGTGIDTIYGGAGFDYIYVLWLEDIIHDDPDGYQLEVSANPDNERAEPVAMDDFAWVDAHRAVVIPVLENDYDLNDDIEARTLAIVTQPSTGTASVAETGGERAIVYAAAESTFEHFTYVVCDALGACSEAQVEVMVGTGACTIIGSERSESLVGTEGPDIICGLGGDDEIFAGGGFDIVIGGPGDDQMHAGRNSRHDPLDGPDVMWGGLGDDELIGDGDDDVLYGGPGDDVLLSWGGADHLYGGEGNDRLLSYEDNDRLYGGPGDDELDGGEGNDRLVGGRGDDSCANGEIVLACERRPEG